MLKSLLIGIALAVAVVVLIGVFLSQKYKPCCPKCGNRYLDCLNHKKDLWSCRQCLYNGPWAAFDSLAGKEEGGEDESRGMVGR